MIVGAAPARAGLHVPSDSAMLATVRVFVGAFLARYADEEAIEDLRLAVGEACSVMRPHGIRVDLEVDDVRCHVACHGVEPPGDDDDGRMRARLFEALAPDAAWVGGSVRFSLPRTGGAVSR